MITRKTPTWLLFGAIDAVLFGLILALAAVGGALLWLSPMSWSVYLTMLDVRIWTPWKVIGLCILMMQSLLVVRHWPGSKSFSDGKCAAQDEQ